MTVEIFIRYIHFLSIFTLFSCAVCEHLLLAKQNTRAELKRISIIDAVYGLAALIVLTTGLLMWFSVGKPAEFYTSNGVFHAKLLIFVIIVILSLYPTFFFIRESKGNPDERVDIPKKVIMFVRIELLLLCIMPLLATLMSRGIGYFG